MLPSIAWRQPRITATLCESLHSSLLWLAHCYLFTYYGPDSLLCQSSTQHSLEMGHKEVITTLSSSVSTPGLCTTSPVCQAVLCDVSSEHLNGALTSMWLTDVPNPWHMLWVLAYTVINKSHPIFLSVQVSFLNLHGACVWPKMAAQSFLKKILNLNKDTELFAAISDGK